MSNKASDLKNNQMFQSNAKYETHLNQWGLKCALLVSLLICSMMAFGQGWEVRVGGPKEDQAKAVISTVDHGNLLIGFSESYGDDNDIDILAVRTDVDGTIIWQKIYDESFYEQPNAVIELEDGSFVMAGYIREKFNAPNNVYLLKVHRTGRKIWSKTFTSGLNQRAFDLDQTADGGFIIVGETENAATGKSDILVLKVDDEGEEEWRNAFGASDKEDIGKGIVSVPDGYLLAGDVTENNSIVAKNVALYKLDLRGNFVWSKFYGTNEEHEEVSDLLLTQNNELVFVGTAGNYSRALIAKCDLDGDLLWYRELDPAPYDDLLNTVIEMPDGHLVAVGYGFVSAPYSKATLLKLTPEGEVVWERLVGDDKSVNIGEAVALSANDGFVIAGHTNGSADVLSLINDVLLTKVNGDGLYPSNHLTGQVTHLLDGCDGVDGVPLPNWLVEVEGEGNSYYGTTDENGNYDISVAPGAYKVTLLKPNEHWGVCNPVAFFAEFSEFYDTTVTNFTAYTAEECPFMEVDVTAPSLFNVQVDCEPVYTVNFCNLGPVTAEDAYVTVSLDQKLTFNQRPSFAVPSAIDPSGQVLTYDLGDVPSMSCGRLQIETQLDCDEVANGQSLVVKADIFPNEICSDPDPDWDKSTLDLAVDCYSDTVKFRVKNIGDEPMQAPSEYVVVEDQVMFFQGPIEPLGVGEERFVTVPGVTGRTYRMIARQSDGHPGQSLPTVAIEGCAAEDGVGSTGYYTDFPENDQDSNVDIDVQEVISPEKTTHLKGHPNGYKDYILDQKTDIEYTIIFSNIWTDTINRVVIRDTLSPHLDVYSVEPGASSHPYDFEIYNNGIVKFTLSEIQLQPAGSADEASSRGFVKFRISQKPNNPVGTEITNSAAVYFDYYAPQVTNSVDYVIGCTDFLQQGCLEISTNVTEFFPGVKIKVAPNPFFDRATIDIEGITLDEVNMEVYDMMGRLIRSEKYRANKFEVYRDNLPAGMYVFQLRADGQTLATGKIIAR